MKKFKKLLPWIVAGGAIVFAVATKRFYDSKILLEIPTFRINGGELQAILPSVDRPLMYTLKGGETLAVHAVETAKAAVTAA